MRRRLYPAPVSEVAIGSRLRELRKARGLTQVELAQKLGMVQPVLSRYEQGEIRMHGALVTAFARALDTTTDDLLGLKPRVDAAPTKDRRFLRRLQRIEKLPKADKQALLKTIDAFLLKVS